MGAVCSGGTTRRRSASSGKLEKKKSFSERKENSIPYSNAYSSQKIQRGFDREDDRRLQFSSELKPSTPARTGVPKVCCCLYGLDLVFRV